jgi:hypothetical protein
VYTFSSSCVGIPKEPGVPVDFGNYMSVILEEDKVALEPLSQKSQLIRIERENLRYEVLNMWWENYREITQGLNPLEVVAIQCPTTGDRTLIVTDPRIPDSYKLPYLFRGYNTRWLPEYVELVNSATDLKLEFLSNIRK